MCVNVLLGTTNCELIKSRSIGVLLKLVKSE